MPKNPPPANVPEVNRRLLEPASPPDNDGPCIGFTGVARTQDNFNAVKSQGTGMSGMGGSRWLDDPGLSSAAQQRNQPIINEVRNVLLGHDAGGFSRLMGDFAELVEDAGPLAFLRFDAAAFDGQLHSYLAHAQPPRDPEAWCDAVHAAVINTLATDDFLQHMRRELHSFLELPYPPKADRRAVCAALLTTTVNPSTHGLQRAELPAVYAVFRAQLIGWLLHAGHPDATLAGIGAALEEG